MAPVVRHLLQYKAPAPVLAPCKGSSPLVFKHIRRRKTIGRCLDGGGCRQPAQQRRRLVITRAAVATADAADDGASIAVMSSVWEHSGM